MDLYLIRHAEAEPRDEGMPDAARALTSDGRRKWKRAVRGLEAAGTTLERVYHSPWRRAVETAAALERLVREETVAMDALTRPPTRALLEQLRGSCVAIVGHQPWLGELAGILVFGDARRGARIALGKGTVVHLEGEPHAGGMTLRAVLPARVLRRLSRGH